MKNLIIASLLMVFVVSCEKENPTPIDVTVITNPGKLLSSPTRINGTVRSENWLINNGNAGKVEIFDDLGSKLGEKSLLVDENLRFVIELYFDPAQTSEGYLKFSEYPDESSDDEMRISIKFLDVIPTLVIRGSDDYVHTQHGQTVEFMRLGIKSIHSGKTGGINGLTFKTESGIANFGTMKVYYDKKLIGTADPISSEGKVIWKVENLNLVIPPLYEQMLTMTVDLTNTARGVVKIDFTDPLTYNRVEWIPPTPITGRIAVDD